MPVIGKSFAAQNILPTNGTAAKAAASEKGNFDAVLKQTTETGKQSSDIRNKPETAKAVETKADSAKPEDRTAESGRAEENAGMEKTESKAEAGTEKVESKADAEMKNEETGEVKDLVENLPEDLVEKLEVLERAGGEMAAMLAAQLGVPQETVSEAMEELGMTKVSLLDPKNVKELMVHITEGADDMSMLTDGNFYQSVAEALHTLEDITAKLQEETGMTPKELEAAVENAQKLLDAAAAGKAEEIPGTSEPETAPESGEESDVIRVNAPKTVLTETERTEAVLPKSEPENEPKNESKHEPKQGNAGKDSENPYLETSSYQTKSAEVGEQVHAAQTESKFSMAQTQEIMDQIVDYMKVSVKPEITSLEMLLHPETLGTLHIQISHKEGMVTAQFIAQNESVRAALESQVAELRENLEQQGVKVEAVEVTVAQYSLDGNQGRDQGASGQSGRQKKAIRNLNLGELNPEEEELTEDERLTAQMMQSEGSTVNYTA